MTRYVVLLRAVNVGGTGKLPMARLAALCAAAGGEAVRTHLASGNAVLDSDRSAAELRDALEAALRSELGRTVGVLIRTGAEIARAAAADPFADRPGNRVLALFTDAPLPAVPLDGATGWRNEQAVAGSGVIYVHYPDGQGGSRLRLPAEAAGTMRNMNTVRALAELAGNAG